MRDLAESGDCDLRRERIATKKDQAILGVPGGLDFSSGDLRPERMVMKGFSRSNQEGGRLARETAKVVRARPAFLFHQSAGRRNPS